MSRLGRIAAACGIVAPAVAAAGIGTAVLVAPAFSWTRDALSDLGVRPGSAVLFNGGLLLAGVVALPFAWWLWTEATGPLHRAGAVAFGLAFLALGGVGGFPADTGLHTPVAVGFFLAFTYGLFLWGSGDVRAGAVDRGLATVWLGVAHATAWAAWAVALVPAGVTGLALPETAGAVVLAAWSVMTARRARRRGR